MASLIFGARLSNASDALFRAWGLLYQQHLVKCSPV